MIKHDRPFRYANQLPEQMKAAIVSAKREKPYWGARKIRERLLRRLASKNPAASTIHAVLDRHGFRPEAVHSKENKKAHHRLTKAEFTEIEIYIPTVTLMLTP